MTTKTEQSRREMYSGLARVSRMIVDGCVPKRVFPVFEETLEQYLEALRKELRSSHEATGTVALLLHEAKTERDELRNRLQAFEFANKACGEELRAASELIQRQRKFIRTLYTSRKARKTKGSTSAQSSKEVFPVEVLEALPMLCQHSWRTQFADLGGKIQKQCIFCLTIED